MQQKISLANASKEEIVMANVDQQTLANNNKKIVSTNINKKPSQRQPKNSLG